jgi:hypothetical protein
MNRRTRADKLVESYLGELRRALAGLPASRRREVIEEVADHIAEGRALLGSDDEASVRALLDRVGAPTAIAAEAGAAGVSAWSGRGEAWAPWLLLLGGFAFAVGWFAGVGLLWSSATWRLRDKLLGTFVLPGGLALFPFLASASTGSRSCSYDGGPGMPAATHCVTSGIVLAPALGVALAVFLLLAPFVTFIRLRRVRAGRRWRASEPRLSAG